MSAEPPSPPRDFTYIKPSKRRLSEYEAVSLYVQTDPDVPNNQLYMRTEEGRPAWLPESTRLRHPHWYDFRDPGRYWQRPYVRMQAEQEQAIERLVEDAKAAAAFDAMDRGWLESVLRDHYRVWSFFEYGLFRAFGVAQREALSDPIGNALTFQGFDHMRHAQAVVLYLLDLEGAIEGFRDQGAKKRWLEEPAYQPLRQIAEELISFEDWAELCIVTNFVVLPLVAEVMATKNCDEWMEILVEAAIPCGPVNNMEALFSDPQIAHRDMVAEVEHPTIGTLRLTGIPVKYSATPGQVTLPPPLLGEHTDEILSSVLGCSSERIEELKRKGAI